MSGAVEVQAAWRRFLDAIEVGDATALGSCLAADVTMFLPFANNREGERGRDAVVGRFARAFEVMRAALNTTRLVEITVESFSARELGNGYYLVESLLSFGTEKGRRSVIYGHSDSGWQILHLHASNLNASGSARLPPLLG